MTAWISRNVFDGVTYTVRHGLLTGMRRRGGLGFLPGVIAPGAETEEVRFWRGLDLRGKVVYDIGAFHGLLALHFARQATQVICFEPNSSNRARLQENLTLNAISNVLVRDVGLGDVESNEELTWNPSMPGGGTLDSKGRSGILSGLEVRTEVVRVVRLDDDRERSHLPAPDLIKIDIEGFELQALQGGRATLDAFHPALYIEMHGETWNEKLRKVAAIVAYLQSLGYREIRHVESGVGIGGENSATAAEGHLYCLPGATDDRR